LSDLLYILTHSAEEDRRRAAEAALAAARLPRPPPTADPDSSMADRTGITEQTDGDGDTTFAGGNTTKSSGSAGTTKRSAKVKLTAKEKKERAGIIERVIGQLPLAFRGNDPVCRQCCLNPCNYANRYPSRLYEETRSP
jgi:DASH complex subunit DAM1